jgi:hypothetical protein
MRAVSVPFVVRTVVVLAHLVGLVVLGAPGPVTWGLTAALAVVWAAPVLLRGERLRRPVGVPVVARAG